MSVEVAQPVVPPWAPIESRLSRGIPRLVAALAVGVLGLWWLLSQGNNPGLPPPPPGPMTEQERADEYARREQAEQKKTGSSSSCTTCADCSTDCATTECVSLGCELTSCDLGASCASCDIGDACAGCEVMEVCGACDVGSCSVSSRSSTNQRKMRCATNRWGVFGSVGLLMLPVGIFIFWRRRARKSESKLVGAT